MIVGSSANKLVAVSLRALADLMALACALLMGIALRTALFFFDVLTISELATIANIPLSFVEVFVGGACSPEFYFLVNSFRGYKPLLHFSSFTLKRVPVLGITVAYSR